MEFMHYYRDVFPEASINTPKLHILEDHMVNLLLNWRVGCGLLGEQGAESIHNEVARGPVPVAKLESLESRLDHVSERKGLK